MSLDPNYLNYPERHYGMDHQRYSWVPHEKRPKPHWPNGAKLAVWLNISLQHFPLDSTGKPFIAPGGLTMPYPDLRHFSLRDYGNRVGIFRLLAACDKHKIEPSFAINAELCERAPYLMQQLAKRKGEILAHGWNMNSLHFGGQDRTAEQALVEKSIALLQNTFGRPVKGWLSPAKNQSENTPELLAQAGIEYLCDWVNDELPYPFNTEAGNLWSLPLSTELEDQFVIVNNQHAEDSYVEQVQDATQFLLNEASAADGRILTLNVHPWVLGQPHRLKRFEQILAYIKEQNEIWFAQPGEILEAFSQSTGEKVC